MSSNQDLLAKADIALTDITTNKLNAEQANSYIRKLIKSPTIFREARVVSMSAPSRKIDKIIFSQRIMRPAVSATALPQSGNAGTGIGLGGRAKPVFDQVVLNTSEVIAEVRIPYDVMEDQIERATTADNGQSNAGPGGLRQTIIELIGERSSLDLEELALLGDTTSGDTYLALQNGWNKIVNTSGNVVSNANATINKTLFKNGKKAMPPQYLRNLPSLKHYVSVNQQTEFQDTYANRVTAVGDNALQNSMQLWAYGSPVSAVQQMPEAQGLFLNPLNLLFGVQRDMSMEFDKDITARVYIIVLTARVAVQIEEPLATVAYTNIG
jgi:hypothetical protein